MMFASAFALTAATFLTIAAPWLTGHAIDTGLGVITSTNLSGQEVTNIEGDMGNRNSLRLSRCI